MSKTPTVGRPESGPQCFECGYSLLGLTENRCPECGKEFDPRDWLPLSHKGLWRSNPWDKAQGISSFLETFTLSLIDPAKLFKKYHGYFDDNRSFAYGCICLSLGAAELVLTNAQHGSFGAIVGIAVAAAAWIGAGVIHSLGGLILELCLEASRWRPGVDYWRPHVRYLSGFFVLTNACTLLADPTLNVPLLQNPRAQTALLFQLALIAWWATSLILAAKGNRPQSAARQLLAGGLAVGLATVSMLGYWFVVGIGLALSIGIC